MFIADEHDVDGDGYTLIRQRPAILALLRHVYATLRAIISCY